MSGESVVRVACLFVSNEATLYNEDSDVPHPVEIGVHRSSFAC